MTDITQELNELDKQLDLLIQIKRAQQARRSFYDFSKYVIGYNGKPNPLIVPHAHYDLCAKLQYTLKDFEDVGALKLGEEGGRLVYDAFNRYEAELSTARPPLAGLSINSLTVGPLPEHSRVKEKKAEPVNLTENTNSDTIIEEATELNTAKAKYPSVTGLTMPPYAEIKKFILSLMPRGSFKSTIGTESFPCYAWLFNPNLRIHIASETLSKAKLYFGAVKQHLEANENYREEFRTIYGVLPDANRERWTQDELNIAGKQTITREPNLSCGSPEVPKVGQHYDIIIVDDLVGQTNISDTGLEAAHNYYRGLLSVLEPGGVLIFIGTRWHFKDVYGYILVEEADRFDTIIHGAINEDGSLFFPERLTEQFLAEQRKSQGSFFFSAQYMNKIVDDETAKFRRSYFINRKVEQDEIDNLNVFMMVDPVPPGSDEKNDPDYFAISIGGMDKMGDLYYLDGWQGRPTVGEAIDKFFEFFQKWEPKLVGFEAVGFQKVYSFNIMQEARNRGISLPIREIKRSNKGETKAYRIERLVPYYENGRVIHKLGAGFVDKLEDQLTEFPRSHHDDLLDSLADLLAIGYPPSRKNVDTEEKKERREKMERLRSFRNKITRC